MKTCLKDGWIINYTPSTVSQIGDVFMITKSGQKTTVSSVDIVLNDDDSGDGFLATCQGKRKSSIKTFMKFFTSSGNAPQLKADGSSKVSYNYSWTKPKVTETRELLGLTDKISEKKDEISKFLSTNSSLKDHKFFLVVATVESKEVQYEVLKNKSAELKAEAQEIATGSIDLTFKGEADNSFTMAFNSENEVVVLYKLLPLSVKSNASGVTSLHLENIEYVLSNPEGY